MTSLLMPTFPGLPPFAPWSVTMGPGPWGSGNWQQRDFLSLSFFCKIRKMIVCQKIAQMPPSLWMTGDSHMDEGFKHTFMIRSRMNLFFGSPSHIIWQSERTTLLPVVVMTNVLVKALSDLVESCFSNRSKQLNFVDMKLDLSLWFLACKVLDIFILSNYY